MFPMLNIGPLAIQAPGLLILVGLWLWFVVNDHIAKKFNLNAEILSNHFFYSLVLGLVGARLAFVVQNPRAFIDNPLAIISPNLALFDFTSGVLLAILFFLIVTQRKKMSVRTTLDSITPGLLVFLALTALAFLANGKLYGLPSDLPWSIYLWGTLRHPLQIYYLVLLLLAAYVTFKQSHPSLSPGALFYRGIAYIAFVIIFLEAFRGSPTAMLGNVRIPQLIAFVVLLIALNSIKFKKSVPTETTKVEIPPAAT